MVDAMAHGQCARHDDAVARLATPTCFLAWTHDRVLDGFVELAKGRGQIACMFSVSQLIRGFKILQLSQNRPFFTYSSVTASNDILSM